MQNFVLTSASVTDGHPDKLCDCISDAIIDAYLTRDPAAVVNAECAVAAGIAFLAVHTDTAARVDLPEIVHATVAEAGYADTDYDPQSVTVLSSVMPSIPIRIDGADPNTADTASVNTTVFGYACDQMPEMLPLAIVLAHRLARRMKDVRAANDIAHLHPDGQAQVSVRYEGRRPKDIEGVTLIAASTDTNLSRHGFTALLREAIVEPVLTPEYHVPDDRVMIISSTGPGGPTRHAGLTGRKNDIDTYGSYSRHGGAALSGKDPSRMDRTGCYAARYAAKNVVAAGLADECEVQISYAMGRSEPVSVDVDTFSTGRVPDDRIARAICREIDFTPSGLSEAFALHRIPRMRDGRFFRDLGAFGHFARKELDLPWEATDCAKRLAASVA
jgi:S-adenosylmethionine synthetase